MANHRAHSGAHHKQDRTTRRQVLRTAALGAGAGLALALDSPAGARAAGEGPAATPTLTPPAGPAGCAESKAVILDTILRAERVATTFYYTGLTTGAITTPAAPPAPGVRSRGQLNHLAYVRRALAEEQRHTELWQGVGAATPYGTFYYPAATFTRPGYTSQAGLFLGVLDYLETVLIGTYLAAIGRLGALKYTDLSVMAVQVLQVECTHRVLGRAIAGDSPADNVTLEVESFPCVSDAVTALQPFVTGQGFQGGATAAIALPSATQVARVVTS